MADTLIASGLEVQQWEDTFYTEYIRDSRFRPYYGTSENAVIQMKEDLTKKRGDAITCALINKLSNSAVTGSNTLEGNEEDMASRSFTVNVNKLRNAVRIAEMEEFKSAIDLRDAARSVLKDWMMEQDRDRIIAALDSKNGVAYASASEANKDAWLVDNADRVLFGAAVSNNAANDHSDALGQLDNTSDKLTPSALQLLKRRARSVASPKIRPIRIKGDEEWYVVFAGSLTFRDLSANSTITQANREARVRGLDNPIFTGADLIYDGMIIREVPEMNVLTGVGGGSIDVAPVYLCGAQALLFAIGKRISSRTKEFDYGDKYGVAIEQIRAIEKMTFGSGSGDTDDLKDNGVATGYFASVADS